MIRHIVAEDDPLIVSVLGDSTGNDTDEWVTGWAKHLADRGATVSVSLWDPATGVYGQPVEHGSGEREVVIWNGSLPGQPADAALPLLEQLQPQSPSLIIYNFGHNRGKISTGAALQKLTTAASTRWGTAIPMAAVLQNPGNGDQAPQSDEGRKSVAGWAAHHAIPTIDVHAAFVAHPDWATKLMRDTAHPSPAGSQVWTATVVEVLG